MKSVRVGAKVYSVEVVATDEVFEENPKADAYTDYAACRIRIRGAAKQFEEENLLHEILHTLLENSGLQEEVDAEKIVKMIAPRLHGLLRDNPEFQKSFCS